MAPRRSWAKTDTRTGARMSRLGIEALWTRWTIAPARPHDSDVDAVGSPSAERGGSAQGAEDLQKLRRKKPGRQPKNGQPNRLKRPRRNRYSVRTASGPIALRAFWSMHVEAMNWSGMGTPSMPQRLVFRSMRCAYGVIA
jgi:hypothetical protein